MIVSIQTYTVKKEIKPNDFMEITLGNMDASTIFLMENFLSIPGNFQKNGKPFEIYGNLFAKKQWIVLSRLPEHFP